MFIRSRTLQDMCLIAIVKDIDLFVYNKTIPEKHINFLFQAYSNEVFAKHKVLKKSISEDCMLWFLNPHVKKVTLPPCFHSERIIQQLKKIGSGIISLNLHNSKIDENELNSIFDCLPHVINLDLSGTSCTDATLACIGKSCPDLQSLNISCCENITDVGMDILCDSRLSLKNLNLLYSGVECLGTAIILNGMPSIESIKCDDLSALLYEIGRNKQYNLTELLYDAFLEKTNSHMKAMKACNRMCPRLKKLHFEFPVEEKVLKACARFKNLEELKIKLSHRYNAPIRVYHVLTTLLPMSNNLKTLILSCMEISALTLVECFRNLENLHLRKVSFTPYKKEDVKITKTNLRTLVIKDIDFENNDVTCDAISLLISLSKNVTELHLSYIKYLPFEVSSIISKSMKNLTSINLEFTDVTLHFLNQLFEIPSLTTISANVFEDPQEIFAGNLLAKKTSCTLSWRSMYGSDEENEDEDDRSNDDKYYYQDDSGESDASEQCYSTSSDTDDDMWPYPFEDYDGEYEDWYFNDPDNWFGYDPYL